MHIAEYGARPTAYAIEFDIDLKRFMFYGKERIAINIKKPTRRIVLDSIGLSITAAVVIKNNERVELKRKTTSEELIVELKRRVSGAVDVLIEFNGSLNDSMVGRYRSKYAEGKYIATTQFEPADACRAFPCFDHPALKATFDISITADSELIAVSNMPVKKEKINGSKKTAAFERTPRMSTYLVYIGAGEFEFIEDKYRNIVLRGITTPGKAQQC